jgi:hypothetical protein
LFRRAARKGRPPLQSFALTGAAQRGNDDANRKYACGPKSKIDTFSRGKVGGTGQKMKKLLIVTAVIELGAGAALMCFPSMMLALLLGPGLDTAAAATLGRLAGVALSALGVACWLAQYDAQSRAARGLVSAMVVYNIGAVVVLGSAGVWSQSVGVALWPAVVLHAGMAAWCITALLSKPAQFSEKAK